MKKYEKAKKMRTIAVLVLVFAMMFSLPAAYAENENRSDKTDTKTESSIPSDKSALAPNSETAVVIDMTSDYVLFDKDKDKKMYPASMTKIMTALLTVENKSMDDTVVVSESAVSGINKYECTNVDLNPGDVETVDELMHALLIPSANDAANVLAEYVGGSIEGFADMMNKRAAELGCKNTHFANANGLHDENHYTTAYDMALIAKEAMKRPEIAEIVGLWSFQMKNSGLTYASTNHLVSRYVNLDYYYENATGIKTGYTDEAQRTLAASATDGEHSIIAVVMGCKDKDDGTMTSFVDAKQLFQYFFKNYENLKYISANQIIVEKTVKNASGDGRMLLTTPVTKEAYLPKGTGEGDLKYDIKLTKKLEAPIKKNEKLGYATVSYGGEKISTIELYADRNVDKSYVKAFFNLLGGFKIIVVILAVLLVLFIIMFCIRQRNLRRRRIRRAERMRQMRQREEEEREKFRNTNF